MKKLIVVADWVPDTLTVQEFRSVVEGFLTSPPVSPPISFVSSTPSTIHTSYLINQIIEVEERFGRPQNTVIFENTDPRLQKTERAEKAQGASFVVARLEDGIFVCGPNAGYDFSIFKTRIEKLYIYQDLDKGTQFRSRDFYTRIAAHLMENMEDELDLEEISLNNIPELTGFFVGHIDNYGNIKTTIKHEDLKGKHEYGEEIEIDINNTKKKAIYVDNLFGGEVGKLVIYPGSSGEKDNPYLEISAWTHFKEQKPRTGISFFPTARPGDEIKFK